MHFMLYSLFFLLLSYCSSLFVVLIEVYSLRLIIFYSSLHYCFYILVTTRVCLPELIMYTPAFRIAFLYAPAAVIPNHYHYDT